MSFNDSTKERSNVYALSGDPGVGASLHPSFPLHTDNVSETVPRVRGQGPGVRGISVQPFKGVFLEIVSRSESLSPCHYQRSNFLL